MQQSWEKSIWEKLKKNQKNQNNKNKQTNKKTRSTAERMCWKSFLWDENDINNKMWGMEAHNVKC